MVRKRRRRIREKLGKNRDIERFQNYFVCDGFSGRHGDSNEPIFKRLGGESIVNHGFYKIICGFLLAPLCDFLISVIFRFVNSVVGIMSTSFGLFLFTQFVGSILCTDALFDQSKEIYQF